MQRAHPGSCAHLCSATWEEQHSMAVPQQLVGCQGAGLDGAIALEEAAQGAQPVVLVRQAPHLQGACLSQLGSMRATEPARATQDAVMHQGCRSALWSLTTTPAARLTLMPLMYSSERILQPCSVSQAHAEKPGRICGAPSRAHSVLTREDRTSQHGCDSPQTVADG